MEKFFAAALAAMMFLGAACGLEDLDLSGQANACPEEFISAEFDGQFVCLPNADQNDGGEFPTCGTDEVRAATGECIPVGVEEESADGGQTPMSPHQCLPGTVETRDASGRRVCVLAPPTEEDEDEDGLFCGEGTVPVEGGCAPAEMDPAPDDESDKEDPVDSEEAPDAGEDAVENEDDEELFCGEGTILVEGGCAPEPTEPDEQSDENEEDPVPVDPDPEEEEADPSSPCMVTIKVTAPGTRTYSDLRTAEMLTWEEQPAYGEPFPDVGKSVTIVTEAPSSDGSIPVYLQGNRSDGLFLCYGHASTAQILGTVEVSGCGYDTVSTYSKPGGGPSAGCAVELSGS